MARILQHVLFVGLNDKDTKTQVITNESAKNKIMDIVGACTISDAEGCYNHNDGQQVREKTYRVEILFKEKSEVVELCKKLKKELNQESIALTSGVIESELV